MTGTTAQSSTPAQSLTLTATPSPEQTVTATQTVTLSFTCSSTSTPQPDPTATPTSTSIVPGGSVVLAYPNPYRPGSSLYVYAGMAQNARNATISIYTYGLRLIREVPVDVPVTGPMEIENKHLNDLTTGIYHFVISVRAQDDKIRKSGIQNLIIMK
jgi:hypothetical protein